MQAVDPAEEYFPEAHQEQDLVQFALDVKRSEWAYFANGVGEGKHAVKYFARTRLTFGRCKVCTAQRRSYCRLRPQPHCICLVSTTGN